MPVLSNPWTPTKRLQKKDKRKRAHGRHERVPLPSAPRLPSQRIHLHPNLKRRLQTTDWSYAVFKLALVLEDAPIKNHLNRALSSTARPYLLARILNLEVKMLNDTGAYLSCLNEEIFNQLEQKSPSPNKTFPTDTGAHQLAHKCQWKKMTTQILCDSKPNRTGTSRNWLYQSQRVRMQPYSTNLHLEHWSLKPLEQSMEWSNHKTAPQTNWQRKTHVNQNSYDLGKCPNSWQLNATW